LHDLSKFLMDLHFIQANAIVGAELQGNKQAIPSCCHKRHAEYEPINHVFFSIGGVQV